MKDGGGLENRLVLREGLDNFHPAVAAGGGGGGGNQFVNVVLEAGEVQAGGRGYKRQVAG